MIKEIKSWFTKDKDSEVTTLNVSAQMTLANSAISWDLIKEIRAEVITQVSNKFIEENGEAIKKEILNNPEFAKAVYNAIVLKKADKI